MSRSKTTYDAIYICFKLLSAIGVFPVFFDGTCFRFSFIKTFYSILLAGLLSYGLYNQIIHYVENTTDDSLMYSLMHFYPMVANTFVCILLIFCGFYGSSCFISYANKVENQPILTKFKQYANFKAYYKQIIFSALIFTLPYFVDFFFEKIFFLQTFTYFQGSICFSPYNYVFLNVFSLSLLTVRVIYQSINERMEKLYIGDIANISSRQSFDPVKAWKFLSGTSKQVSSNKRGVCFIGEFRDTEESRMLYELRGEYHNLYRLCRRLNAAFAPIIMLLTLHHGILGVIFSYWGLRYTLSKTLINDWAELVGVFRSAILSFVSIIWIVVPVTKVIREVDHTGDILQAMLISSKEKLVLSEVKTFSFQVLIENVSFSPYGFFELNHELLLSMTGAVASYLIILLQYQILLDDQAVQLASLNQSSV